MPVAILSLDIGTSITKAVLFDLSGRELRIAEQAYQLQTPNPDQVELDPYEIWGAVVAVCQGICADLPSGYVISSVALSTQGGTLIPVGRDGEPTYNAITWLDRRAQDIVAGWQERELDHWIRQISGWAPQPGLPLAVICALRQFQPDVFNTTAKFLSVNDFVAEKLTGVYCTNPSMAGEMLLTEIHAGVWSQALCDFAGISLDQLSPIQPSEAICGEIRPEICRQIGLQVGTPLINGGQDHSCEALALGLVSPEQFLLACGTAWVINGVVKHPGVEALPAEMALNYHVIPERWIASQYLGGFGAGMEWWLGQFWQQLPAEKPLPRDERYASFNDALMETEPGSSGLLFYPFGGTPRLTNPGGGYAGLGLHHTRADMGRALLESATYELRWAIDRIEKAGMSMNELWMVGGATGNAIWPQIIADVTGKTVALTQYSHGPALGAAILAIRGLGMFDQYPRWVTAHKLQPNYEHTPVYNERYAAYLNLTGGL